MPSNGSPNTIAFTGFDLAGQVVCQQELSLEQFPDARPRWDDPLFVRQLGIVRVVGDLFDDVGQLEQHYDWKYDAQGRFQGGKITYADGRVHPALTCGLEPSTIVHGELKFTAHYVRNTSNPQAPNWFAFTLVLFDPRERAYPVEYFQIPKEHQPPAIDGSGATHYEAYQIVRRKLLALPVGALPKS